MPYLRMLEKVAGRAADWRPLQSLEDELQGRLLNSQLALNGPDRTALSRAAVPLLMGLAVKQARDNALAHQTRECSAGDLARFEQLMGEAMQCLPPARRLTVVEM